jgi:hypothetical protein
MLWTNATPFRVTGTLSGNLAKRRPLFRCWLPFDF